MLSDFNPFTFITIFPVYIFIFINNWLNNLHKTHYQKDHMLP